MDFNSKLDNIIRKNNSLLCVGLDTRTDRLPKILTNDKDAILKFNKEIIESTKDLVCAYKPNIAFYEAMGTEGLRILEETLKLIPSDIIIILDAKRADIGYTSQMYAKAAFDMFNADAITVNPYLGLDAIDPFINRKDKGAFVLCLTTNPGSKDFQKKKIVADGKEEELFLYVAKRAKEANVNKNIGLVVGATNPEEISCVRETVDDLVFLVPGVGAQGGDLEKVLKSGLRQDKKGLIINVTRDIIFATSESNFAKAAREKAVEYRNRINELRF